MTEHDGLDRNPSPAGPSSARQRWFDYLKHERERQGWTLQKLADELGLQSRSSIHDYFKRVVTDELAILKFIVVLSKQPGYQAGLKALQQRDGRNAVLTTAPVRRALPLWRAALREQRDEDSRRAARRQTPPTATSTPTDPDLAETLTPPTPADPDAAETRNTRPEHHDLATVPVVVPAVPSQPPPLLRRLAAHPIARLIGDGVVFVVTGPKTVEPPESTTWSARLGRRLDHAARMFVGALAIFGIMIVVIVVRYHPSPGPGDDLQIPPFGDPSITPAISLHPDHGIPGATLTLDADGFRPGESIEITVSGSAISTDVAGLYTGQTDNNGHLELQIQVPDPPPSTQCEVLATGARSLAFAVTTLKVDPTPRTSHT